MKISKFLSGTALACLVLVGSSSSLEARCHSCFSLNFNAPCVREYRTYDSYVVERRVPTVYRRVYVPEPAYERVVPVAVPAPVVEEVVYQTPVVRERVYVQPRTPFSWGWGFGFGGRFR